MGAGGSLPQEELNELIRSTNFNKQEIKLWYAKFIRDYPDGQLDKEQFMTLFKNVYKSRNTEQLAEHIFRSFDSNADNRISFKELMCSFSVTSRGTVEDKLKWAFSIYDVNGDGLVTMAEVNKIVKSMQQFSNTFRRQRIGDEEAQLMFVSMDANADGMLSVDEFIAGVRKNPTFVNLLNGKYEISSTYR